MALPGGKAAFAFEVERPISITGVWSRHERGAAGRLRPEVRAVIVEAWARGGRLPPAIIKAMVPGAEPEAMECPTT